MTVNSATVVSRSLICPPKLLEKFNVILWMLRPWESHARCLALWCAGLRIPYVCVHARGQLTTFAARKVMQVLQAMFWTTVRHFCHSRWKLWLQLTHVCRFSYSRFHVRELPKVTVHACSMPFVSITCILGLCRLLVSSVGQATSSCFMWPLVFTFGHSPQKPSTRRRRIYFAHSVCKSVFVTGVAFCFWSFKFSKTSKDVGWRKSSCSL